MRFAVLLFAFTFFAASARAGTAVFDDAAAFTVARTTKLGVAGHSGSHLSSNRKVAVRCRPGHIKRGDSCVACSALIPNCQTCSTETICTVCRPGYGFEDGKCADRRCAADADCRESWACVAGICVELICPEGMKPVDHACRQQP